MQGLKTGLSSVVAAMTYSLPTTRAFRPRTITTAFNNNHNQACPWAYGHQRFHSPNLRTFSSLSGVAAAQTNGKVAAMEATGSGDINDSASTFKFPFLDEASYTAVIKESEGKAEYEALENFSNILGVPQLNIIRQFIIGNSDSSDKLLIWKDVRRGSDLFVRGWGGFDIEGAHKTVYLRQLRQTVKARLSKLKKKELQSLAQILNVDGVDSDKVLKETLVESIGDTLLQYDLKELLEVLSADKPIGAKDTSLIWPDAANELTLSNKDWIVDPADLQVEGYFGRILNDLDDDVADKTRAALTQILSGDKMSLSMQHLARCFHLWIDPATLVHLDVLLDAQTMVCDMQSRQEDTAGLFDWAENDLLSKTPAQLIKKDTNFKEEMDAVGSTNRKYKCWDNLKDSKRFRVIRSDLELYRIGKTLSNCCFDYKNTVSEGSEVMVVLHDKKKTKKAIAVASIKSSGGGLCEDFDQIRMKNNSEPTDSMRQDFDKFLSIIEAYNKQYK